MIQAACEIVNDMERTDVLETKYIMQKMKDALNKGEMKWRKRSAGVVACERT